MRRIAWSLAMVVVAAVAVAACGSNAREGVGAIAATGASSPTSSAGSAASTTAAATATTAPNTTTALATTTRTAPALRPAESPSPTGSCDGFEIRRVVFVVVGGGPSPSTGCTRVAPSQELLLANQSNETVEVVLGERRFEVPVTGREYLNVGRAGDLLAPGLHELGERQFWLVAEPPTRLPTATLEMGYYGELALGMTVREAQANLGGELVIEPRFNGWDGHPIPTTSRPMASTATAYFATYDASMPTLSLRASGTDPLDAVITWITPPRGVVPAAVRVGWTETQVRAVFGERLVTPASLTCAARNQVILAVYDGEPASGTHRVWFVFENGLLRSASTSSVTLGETGVMDC